MDKKYQKKQPGKREYIWRRRLAVMLIFCLLLTSFNFGSLLTYATEDSPETFEVGANVTATLVDGVLTLEGYGDTDDFMEDTAPFLDYAQEIHALEIEDGITYLGAYLFYGLGELQGELRLPGSIAGFGDYAFSGDSLKHAPKFSVIYNEFEDSEVVMRDDEDGDLEDDLKEVTEETAGKETEAEKEPEKIQGTESDDSVKAGHEAEDLEETKAPEETEISEETKAPEETKLPEETKVPEETKISEETKAPEETNVSEETAAQRETKAPEEVKAPKETKAPGEAKAPKETRASEETKALKETEPEIQVGFSVHSVSYVWASENEFDDGSGAGDTSNSDTSDAGNTTGSDHTSDTDDAAGSDGAADADGAVDSDDTSDADHTAGSDDTSDVDDTAGSDDIADIDDTAGSDDATIVDDTVGSNDTSGIGNTTGSNDTSDTGNTTGSDHTSDTGNTAGSDHLSDADNTADGDDPSESVHVPESDSGTQDTTEDAGKNHTEESAGTQPTQGNQKKDDYSGTGKPDKADDGETIVRYMTEQQMEHPETLFYEGQSGYFLCSEDNIAFIEAAEEAGYEQADRFVTAMLDDGAAVMELPVRNDMVLLPECPQDLIGPYEEDLFFANAFAGWTVGEGEEGTIWKAGEYLDIRGQDVIDLYSSWKLTERHPLEVMVERADGIAAYTVIDSDTGKEPEAPARYVFLYQWQISDATPSDSQYLATASDADLIEEEATASNARATASNATRAAEDQSGWMDIEGEDDPVYERIIGEADGKLRFRCMVTAVSLLRSRAAGSQVVMYSEPAAGAATEVTVYVDQASGNDSNNGMEETTPFKTLGKAAEALKQNSGGDVHSNRIVLLSDYQLQSTDLTGDKWFNGIAVPATISGKKETIKLTGVNGEKADNNNFTLTNPIIFENLTLNLIGHIYCDGNDITIGQGITTKGYPYLYGAGNSTMPATMNNTISVQSGHISRIAGYVRANSNVDVGNKPVAIEVSGGTVDTIIAGSANGNIKNAKVKIDVSGGNVTTLTGGCQGFQNQQAEYTGITEIDISGGKVTNLYGAGTGRDISAPVFKGKLDIHVSGGEVTKICGSGSAASVASDEAAISNPSQVNITVSGGTVKDIYAAGRGGDDSVSTYNGTTMTTETAKDFGSLKGKATITIEGQAIIGGDIYASGEGYVLPSGKVSYGQKNAYLDGTCTIVMKGGTVKGNIYGGGKGIDQEGCSECARVTEDSKVIISMEGGTVEGDVYGGGRIARSFGSTSVNIVENVTIHGNVYGGAYGKVGDTCVYGSSTVNMTGGWIRGNLYGGSNLSDTGEVIPEEGTPEYITKKDLYDKHNSGLVFVNLVGGTVDGKVFGGGNKGIVNGSTHLHIGTKAIGKCRHYSDSRYTADSPDALQPRTHLAVGGSVYAGGDYGNEQTPGEDGYNTETVTGYSHVYIDGEGYRFRSDGTDRKLMELSGGVFGSGASCDAGSVRLVTLDHFGERITDGSGKVTGTYGKLTSIQRADQVRLINSHVQLSGQSDAANQDKTALYALNRIGDTTEDKDLGKLGDLENSLVLKGGSTLVLDSESIKIANYKSVDDNDKPVGLTSDESALSVENTVLFTSGTTLHVSYTGEAGTDAAGSEIHGSVSGYSYMEIADQAEAYIYARLEPKPDDPVDGGFAAFGEKGSDGKQKMIDPIKVEAENYRYWKLAEEYSVSERQTVLTARRDTASSEEYICAKGTIELPPAGSKATYQITKIELSPNVTFANAAMDQNGTWQYASTVKTEDDKTAEHNKIKNGPLKTFGLFMHPGKGFGSETQNTPMVISSDTIDTIISTAPVTLTNATPQVEFYLTYYNPGITISQDLGSVKMTAVRTDENGVQDTIILQIDLVTKATELVAQTIDLYATQSGSYTGKWIIPAEADRTMRLIKVTTDATGFVPTTGSLSGNQFAVAMQPEKGLGWKTNDLMSKAHFLQKNDSNILLGSTDNRYEAPVHFTLYNAGGFSKKENPDTIKLTFGSSGTDGKETPVDITLNIHWNESVVSKIDVASGKHYDVFTGESGIVISGESAVTSAFTLGKAITPRDLWMELQDKDGNVASLPAGTNLTMLKTGSTKYYRYQATGDETEHRIQLTGFKEMWTGTPFSENLLQNDVLMVIMEFDNSGSLKNGEYSLHLRDDRSADTAMADFTVNNTQVSVALRGGDGLQEPKAKYDLTLTVNAGNDTRLSKGTAAVFTLDDGKPFPDGTVFTHDGKTYTPMNGKVYMLLDSGVSEHTIAMDTTGSAAGLEEGKHYLTAKILSVGLNAGSKVLSSDGKVDYTVKALPQYGLKVESNDKRNVGAGSQITFTVTYSVSNVGTKEQVIGVTARKKSGASYEEGISWSTSGNSPISPEAGSASGSQTIQVTVPQDIEPGTYRLVFTLGEKTAVYNIIVTAGN